MGTKVHLILDEQERVMLINALDAILAITEDDDTADKYEALRDKLEEAYD